MLDKKSSSSPKHFSKQEAISVGFNVTKKNFRFLLGLFLIVGVIFIISQALQATSVESFNLLNYIILNILSWIVSVIIGMGVIRITLKLIDKKKAEFMDLFHTQNIVSFVIASILRGIIVFAGIILLIIPGVIFSLRLQFVTYLIVDKNMGPMDAIKKSWNMTRGNTWHLFLLWILLAFVNFLGLLVFVVGLLFTVPLSMLATAYVYRRLLR